MRKKIELVFLIFFASGFGGLIYQSIWSHYARLFLGHAAYAQTLVLVVFIGGLAIGAWLCSRVAGRVRNPLRVYALVELAIGVAALLSHRVFVATIDWSFASLLPSACDQATTFCPAQWLVTAALLAPQSILLGATFPLVSSAVLRLGAEQAGHDISTLYFVNSFGAVLGVLASAFVLIPGVGLPGTLVTAGLLNVTLGIVALAMSRVAPPPLRIDPPRADAATALGGGESIIRILLATAFLTGMSSFIYEIVWIRMLSLVLGASTHSFELMLASFILGLALGGLWIRNRVDILPDPVRFLGLVQLAMGVAAAATIPLYIGSFDFMAWLLSSVSRSDGGFVIFNLSSTLISLMIMLPATFCAGMTLPLITYRLLHSREGERALGRVYAVNTLGGIAGVVIAVHLLLEGLGVQRALIAAAAIDVSLGVALLVWASGPRVRRASLRGAVPAAVLALAAIAVTFHIDPRSFSSGVFRTGAARVSPSAGVLFHRDGKTATVTVLEENGVRGIRTNGKPDASLSIDAKAPPILDEVTMTLLGVLPLGHQPDARTAAVIGFGSGMSTSILLASPNLKRVDTVEIEPAMVEGARFFRPVVDPAFTDPRSHIVIDDAKSYFARGRERYDIIVSEPSNPWVSGVASLFTEEFYARLAGYLNEGGVLSQWLHTYEMDATTLASIFAAVSKTFPDFVVYTAIDSDIVLVARKGGAPGRFDPRVLQYPALKPMLDKLKMTDPEVVQRRNLGSSGILAPLFSRFAIGPNSDYYPIVEQRASKTRFTRARVDVFTDLTKSAIPMREMLDRWPAPSPARHRSLAVTLTDLETNRAWEARDAIMGEATRGAGPIIDQSELAARLVAQWSTGCGADLSFDRVLPALVAVAETTGPFLHPEVLAAMWRRVGESRCGRALTAEQRRWLELFEATAQRDSQAMIQSGRALLEVTRDARDSASEYAFFATVTGLVCRGEDAGARELLEVSGPRWVRAGVRATELDFLDSFARQPSAPRPCLEKAR